MKIVTG
jgi:hypothetical protein